MKNQPFIKIALISLTVFLSGCFYQSANNTDIEKAINFCKGSENIVEISIHASGDEAVTCKNGNRINLDSYKIN